MNSTTTRTPTLLRNLSKAYDGSYYTIAGAGGDLREWVEGYEQWLEEEQIGKPVRWYRVLGAQVNLFATVKNGGPITAPDQFKPDLTLLLFPLDGLDVTRLAIFKITHEDRWFDDVIQNMRLASGDEPDPEWDDEEDE